MKGLEEYIEKYGRHFTEELATVVLECKWKSSEIEKTSQNIVYYNVSNATLGDIVFLTNLYYRDLYPLCKSKVKCIKHALDIIGDVNATEYAFNLWLLRRPDFDLTNYI